MTGADVNQVPNFTPGITLQGMSVREKCERRRADVTEAKLVERTDENHKISRFMVECENRCENVKMVGEV